MKYPINPVVAVILIAAVAVFVVTVYFTVQQANYSRAMASELADKCATPSGYTDESWREHMSHHPDRYVECLAQT